MCLCTQIHISASFRSLNVFYDRSFIFCTYLGGFGLVYGCKRSQSGQLYAMKVINKKLVKLKRAENLCRNERKVLEFVDSPFVVCLRYSFATDDDLYLILDLMMGGDLRYHLDKRSRFTETEARYFTARTILGIEALHSQGIIYRDLKPENILMSDDGTTKISDLGLATKINESGLTEVCGTRGYWAPEMIRHKVDQNAGRRRYTKTVDWFSLGCCIYEFFHGVSPFRTCEARKFKGITEKDKAIDAAVVEMEPKFDTNYCNPIVIDLCEKLLDKNGKTRLGVNGAKEIKAHPWFADISWDMIESDREPAPFKPGKDINMFSQSEIGTFDEKVTDGVTLDENDHARYADWDFASKLSFSTEVVESMKYANKWKVTMSNYNSCCNIS